MISIITINYNNKNGLIKTLNSIVSQTCKNFEWIVIDGGSTDGSKELLKDHSDHIHYWISEPDDGIYHAMNKGIKIAKGDYLQFLNSGDYLANNKTIENFHIENYTEDVLYGNAIIVNENSEEISRFIAPNNIKLSYFWSHSLNHQATFFKKRCFEYFLYNENNKIASDVELYMQLIYNGYSFQKINEFIVCYDNSGISNQIKTGEFTKVINNILPPAILADYTEFIAFRDIDLAIMIRKIISSKRIFRHIARILLYPIYLIIK